MNSRGRPLVTKYRAKIDKKRVNILYLDLDMHDYVVKKALSWGVSPVEMIRMILNWWKVDELYS